MIQPHEFHCLDLEINRCGDSRQGSSNTFPGRLDFIQNDPFSKGYQRGIVVLGL